MAGSQAPAAATPQTPAPPTTDTTEIQAEVGDRDITYLRTRAVFRYDYKEQDGPTETNKFRLKLLYAFGPHQRMGVAVEVPVMWKNTATGKTLFGSGDTELTAGANVYHSERFRTGFAGQVIFQTASEQALGGGSAKLKGSWGLTYVLTKRLEFTARLATSSRFISCEADRRNSSNWT